MAGYIGTQPVPQATQTRQTFTTTASQTSFATAGYQAGYLDVFLNGVKLVDGSDYTATNGSDVVLTTGAALDDILEVVAYTAFEVLNQSFTGTTTTENLDVTGTFTSQGIDDNATSTSMTLNASGKVGIGTSSPSERLDVINGLIRFANNITPTAENDGAAYFGKVNGQAFVSNSGGFAVRDNGTNRLVVDTSGNVLQGTENAITGAGGVTGLDQVASTSSSGRSGFTFSAASSTAASVYEMGKSANATVGSHTLVANNESLGVIRFSGSDGTNFIRAAEIKGLVDGTPGTSDMPGALTFLTTADGGTAPTERMRIDSSGHTIIPSGVTLGTTTGVYSEANTLDDYEEGTWTPTVSASTAGTTLLGSSGKYTKVGDTVVLQGTLRWTATTLWVVGDYIDIVMPFNSSVAFSGSAFSTRTWSGSSAQWGAVTAGTTLRVMCVRADTCRQTDSTAFTVTLAI